MSIKNKIELSIRNKNINFYMYLRSTLHIYIKNDKSGVQIIKISALGFCWQTVWGVCVLKQRIKRKFNDIEKQSGFGLGRFCI